MGKRAHRTALAVVGVAALATAGAFVPRVLRRMRVDGLIRQARESGEETGWAARAALLREDDPRAQRHVIAASIAEYVHADPSAVQVIVVGGITDRDRDVLFPGGYSYSTTISKTIVGSFPEGVQVTGVLFLPEAFPNDVENERSVVKQLWQRRSFVG